MVSRSEVTSPLCSVLRHDGQRRKLGCVVLCVAGQEHIIAKICERRQCHGVATHVEFDLGHRPRLQTECIQIFLCILVSSVLKEVFITSCDFPS